jgi:hypothetical protein
MATSQALFGTVLRTRIAPGLRQRGFAGTGQDFHRRVGRNWQAVNIQRSRWNTADETTFTINLGTASAAILAAAREDPNEPQAEIVCHWRARIGDLMPDRRDTWWTIRARASQDELDQTASEIENALLSRGLPELDRMVTDARLLDLYLPTDFSEAAVTQQDKIGPLLRELGPSESFAAYMAALDASAPPLELYSIFDFLSVRMGPARVAKALADLNRRGWEPRQQALANLAHAPATPEVITAVGASLDDPVLYVRMAAAHAAGHLGITDALDRLIGWVGSAPRQMACHAALAGVRFAERLAPGDRERLVAAIRARHAAAVGHERPLLAHALRELGAA